MSYSVDKAVEYAVAELAAPLEHIPGLTPSDIRCLHAAGVATSHQLLGHLLMQRSPSATWVCMHQSFQHWLMTRAVAVTDAAARECATTALMLKLQSYDRALV